MPPPLFPEPAPGSPGFPLQQLHDHLVIVFSCVRGGRHGVGLPITLPADANTVQMPTTNQLYQTNTVRIFHNSRRVHMIFYQYEYEEVCIRFY